MMNKNNDDRKVNWGDKICASLECNGRRLAAVTGIDFTSLEAVKRALLQMAGRYTGMAVMTVRNCTQGWRDVSALATMRCLPGASQRVTAPSAPHVGAQYLIPWAS